MPLLDQLQTVVPARWSDIDDVVTEALDAYEPPLRGYSALSKINPRRGMYGCGTWGCAWPTNYKRWVLKISTDPHEGPITKTVLDKRKLREHLGVSYILDVWQLEERVKSKKFGWLNVWVILREDITPIQVPRMAGGHIGDIVDLLHNIRIAAAGANKYNAGIDVRQNARANSLWRRGLRMAQDIKETRHVADFMSDFYTVTGARLSDVHGGNVGLRRNSLTDIVSDHRKAKYWVAFDLGHSRVDLDVEIPRIKNPCDIKVI